jgi:hypothetical protein
MFRDGQWLRVEGSEAAVQEQDGTVFLALPVRNVGSGIAVLEGWHPWPELVTSSTEHPPHENFRRQIRDIYVASGDVGMWQGAMRDADDEVRPRMAAALAERRPFVIDLLYSDQVGGHRTISRFVATPAGEDRWTSYVGFHWNLDQAGGDSWGRR